MTDLEFLDHAERLLSGVEISSDRLNDDTDADIDNQRTGGMVTLTFAKSSSTCKSPCTRCGWRPVVVVFITNLTACTGWTPRDRASFGSLSRATRQNRRGKTCLSSFDNLSGTTPRGEMGCSAKALFLNKSKSRLRSSVGGMALGFFPEL